MKQINDQHEKIYISWEKNKKIKKPATHKGLWDPILTTTKKKIFAKQKVTQKHPLKYTRRTQIQKNILAVILAAYWCCLTALETCWKSTLQKLTILTQHNQNSLKNRDESQVTKTERLMNHWVKWKRYRQKQITTTNSADTHMPAVVNVIKIIRLW